MAGIYLCGRKNRTVCVAAKLTLLIVEIRQQTYFVNHHWYAVDTKPQKTEHVALNANLA
jgi:hypothetical protein